MTYMIEALHGIGKKTSGAADRIAYRHPYLSYLLMFIVAPLLILLPVVLATAAVMLPVSWLCGWL